MSTNTYTHRGSTSHDTTGPTPIAGTSMSVQGGGFYNLDTTGITFESSDPVLVSYDADDNGNTVLLHKGGSVALHGSDNTVTADSGSLEVSELASTNASNAINVGPDVTSFEGDDIQPSDVINLTGYTQADLDRAFANFRHVGDAESTTISDAETGRALTISFRSGHGSDMPAESQFRVTGDAVSSEAPPSSTTPPTGPSSDTGASQQSGPPSTSPATVPDPSRPQGSQGDDTGPQGGASPQEDTGPSTATDGWTAHLHSNQNCMSFIDPAAGNSPFISKLVEELSHLLSQVLTSANLTMGDTTNTGTLSPLVGLVATLAGGNDATGHIGSSAYGLDATHPMIVHYGC